MKKTFLIAVALLSLCLSTSCSKDCIEPQKKDQIKEEYKSETYFLNLKWTLIEASYESANNGYTWTLKGVPIDPKSGYQPVERLRIYRMTNAEFFSVPTIGSEVPAKRVWDLFITHP